LARHSGWARSGRDKENGDEAGALGGEGGEWENQSQGQKEEWEERRKAACEEPAQGGLIQTRRDYT
jgi:hypothetical protein